MLLRLKLLIARVICVPTIGRLIGAIWRNKVPNNGLRIDLSDPSVTPAIKAQIYWRIYEGAEIQFVRSHLRSNLDVVELGASLGVVTAHIARRLEPGRGLIAVEANPALISSIRRNLSAHGSHLGTVDVVNCAVSNGTTQTMKLRIGETTYGSRLATTSDRAQIEVPARSLRQIVDQTDLRKFALVSDIEGAEAFLLEDSEILGRCSQAILELHETLDKRGHQRSVEQLLAGFLDQGFTLVEREGPVCVFDRRIPISR